MQKHVQSMRRTPICGTECPSVHFVPLCGGPGPKGTWPSPEGAGRRQANAVVQQSGAWVCFAYSVMQSIILLYYFFYPIQGKSFLLPEGTKVQCGLALANKPLLDSLLRGTRSKGAKCAKVLSTH